MAAIRGILTWAVKGSLAGGILLGFATLGSSQTIVNTETLLLDVEEGVAWTASLASDFSGGNANVVDIATDGGFAWKRGDWGVKGAVAWARLTQDGEAIQSNAFGQIRIQKGDVLRLQPFAFVQSSQNNVLKMQLRNLYGIGVKRRLIASELLGLDLSWGAMFEQEYYAPEEQSPDTRLMRNSLILSMLWRVNESCKIRLTSYAQSAYADLADMRLFAETGIDLQLNDWLAIEFGAAFRWDSQPHGGLNPWDVGSVVGLRLGAN